MNATILFAALILLQDVRFTTVPTVQVTCCRVAGKINPAENQTPGSPVPGIPLTAVAARGNTVSINGVSTSSSPVGRTAFIAADGSFEFLLVPSGAYELTVTPDVSIPPLRFSVGNADLPNLQLGVARVRISGTTILEGGPQPRFQLEFSNVTDPARKTIVPAGSTFTSDLHAGMYRVAASGIPPGFAIRSITAGSTDLTQQPFRASEGSAAIAITLGVSGVPPWVRAAGRITGPLASAATTVTLSGPSTAGVLAVSVKPDRSFEFPAVLPGTYEVRVIISGHSNIPIVRKIVVGASGTTNVEIDTPNPKAFAGEFVKIEPGEFIMGCSPPSVPCDPNERPAHRVGITRGFQIGKYEVTQAQWEAVMGNNPSQFPGSDRPVENVNEWQDAQEFITRLNSFQDGYRYRLPTEAEWEYAARAGSQGPHGPADAIGWHSGNSNGVTHPVGEKLPNAWGLYDTQGNVWEWVQDWYSPGYYSESPVLDPRGPISGPLHVVRGGSRTQTAELVRITMRVGNPPIGNAYSYGFRLVREVAP